jgi:hypothetical protein
MLIDVFIGIRCECVLTNWEFNTGPNGKAPLKVTHKYSLCSQLHQGKVKTPTHAEILQQDELWVKSINSRLSNKLASGDNNDLRNSEVRNSEASVSIPAKSSSTIGTDNYVVTIGFGTPKKDLTLVFDTRSDITWTQCQPCSKSC